MPKRLQVSVLRSRDWPAVDQAAWNRTLGPSSLLDPCGGLASYPQSRILVFEASYGRWLGFLSISMPTLAVERGLDYLDRDRVAVFLERLQAVLAPYTVRAYLSDLLTVVRAMAPQRSFEDLEKAVRFICKTAKPVTDKSSHLVPIRNLYALGYQLMEEAPSRNTKLKEAGHFRDGLTIAMVAARPIRLGNLTSIKIDDHLQRRGEEYRLAFRATEVKNRRPLNYSLPPALFAPIDRYLSHYRPHLLERRGRYWRGSPGNALWISEHGSHFTPAQMRNRIKRHTHNRFGSAILPHWFRDCAATSIATEDPKSIGIIMPVLGHASATTGERYYNQAQSLGASRQFQAIVETLRNGPGDSS